MIIDKANLLLIIIIGIWYFRDLHKSVLCDTIWVARSSPSKIISKIISLRLKESTFP